MNADPVIGEIAMFVGREEPRGWMRCDGRLLQVRDHAPLFAVLGSRFGGDGRQQFRLPDLRGRVPMHWGAGHGLTERKLGASGGSAAVALTVTGMPTHTHTPFGRSATAAVANRTSPAGALWSRHAPEPYYGDAVDCDMHPYALASVGDGAPHNNMQPYAVVSFIIAVDGIFPVRG